EVHEKVDVDQGKLVIGYRTGVTLRDDGMYAMTFFNGLFGGLSHSRLFRVVREKAGLAYYVHSALERTKGIMLVGAGIDSAKYGEALRLVRQSLEDIAAGKIEDWEMDATRESLASHLKSLDDAPSVKISSYVERLINGRVLSFEELYDALTGVTKADVAAAAAKVKEDTVYFLSELDRPGS
ncbi:MAG: insulinase family protein, partial [Planctomycetota bacterium]|nr:insulinase family protein [Planctomycetota bacterium]